MKVIEHKHVIPIIRNTLNALDARLVDHGYRVAFFDGTDSVSCRPL